MLGLRRRMWVKETVERARAASAERTSRHLAVGEHVIPAEDIPARCLPNHRFDLPPGGSLFDARWYVVCRKTGQRVPVSPQDVAEVECNAYCTKNKLDFYFVLDDYEPVLLNTRVSADGSKFEYYEAMGWRHLAPNGTLRSTGNLPAHFNGKKPVVQTYEVSEPASSKSWRQREKLDVLDELIWELCYLNSPVAFEAKRGNREARNKLFYAVRKVLPKISPLVARSRIDTLLDL